MSITARDWVELSTVDQSVVERWPDYQVILVAADDVDATALASIADTLFDQAVTDARTIDTIDLDPHVARWQQAYSDFGVKPRVARPSVDALIRRATSDHGLPRINTLVDLYNAISILHRVPIGGEDLDHYASPARLSLAIGDEPFHTTDHGQPLVDHLDPTNPSGSIMTGRRAGDGTGDRPAAPPWASKPAEWVSSSTPSTPPDTTAPVEPPNNSTI